MYAPLEADARFDVPKMREAQCLEAAYEAGVRVDAPSRDQLEYVTTGNPEVVVRRKGSVVGVGAVLAAELT